MWTNAVTPDLIANSVIAVPPLARDSSRKISVVENTKIIRAIEAGGVSTLLYGGNAVFYHMRLTEYADALAILAESAAPNTWIVPSVGPTYGIMMDQAQILKDFHFPTVMILPQKEIADEAGIATGVRHFVDQFGKPIVLY
ncbi:MAG: dihydrodipicolinate synthase family protein, partial [Pirellula sp.]